MLNKDDKNHITGSIKKSGDDLKDYVQIELKKSGDGLKDYVQVELKKSGYDLKDYVQIELKKSQDYLGEKIRQNTDKIGQNGIMIEHLEDLILRIAKNQDITNKKLDRLERRFDESGIDNFPILWEEVKRHAKRITALEIKAA